MALILGLRGIPFPPGLLENVCARPFLSWWQWIPVVRAMQCIASCGPGMLLLALAFPLAPSIVFPDTHAPMHTHTCTCTLFYSLLPHHTHILRHVSTNTQSPDRCTEAQMHLRKRNVKSFSLGEAKRTKPGI